MNKKAQGLPINTVILIAIGLLILVLFIVFVLGGFKGFGSSTNPNSAALQAYATDCNTACSTAATSNNPSAWCSYSNNNIGSVEYSCGNVSNGAQTSCRLNNGTDEHWYSSAGGANCGHAAGT